jgi:gamma-glutamyltranspeptidase/glutathione hydrolase
MAKTDFISRDFFSPGRSLAVGEKGMAATSHPLATLAAVEILKAGGNAVDAALAAVAVQGVVEPQMTGIGGDCFAILAMAGAEPVAVNGSGWSPKGLTPAVLAGENFIREGSPHAVTIPGAVDAWVTMAEKYGRIGLERILAPAIALAEEGFRVTPRVAFDWAKLAGKLSANPAAAELFLPYGEPLRTGDRFANPELAKTLALIAKHGRAAFYEGEVADEIVEILRALGGTHDKSDFAEFRSFETKPISAKFRGRDVYECPPNGQGLAALIILRILDGYELERLSEVDQIHLLAEATKAAYRQRDTIIADHRHMRVTPEDALSNEFIARLRAKIRMNHASDAAVWNEPVHRDTVCLSVVDSERNAVSLINSIFSHFGSGIYAPRAGVLLQNRGCGFSLREDHPNIVGPRKRPLHTIIPGMVFENGKAIMPFGVMGGQYQATGHAHLLTQVFACNKDLQLANETPRSFYFARRLGLEPAISEEVATELAIRGHTIVRESGEPLGGCQAIRIDYARGLLMGGSDHRKDGMALGY